MTARVATALVLAPAAVAVTLWAPVWLFAALALAVMLAALEEWRRLAGGSAAAAVVVAGALVVVAGLLFRAPEKLPMVCLAGLLFWGWQAVHLIMVRAAPPPDARPNAMGGLAQGGFVLLFAWAAILLVRLEQGAAVTIAVLLMLWSADTFAYFAGKRFGRRKLAPALSPGKTIEGLFGGLAGAGLVALAAVPVLGLDGAHAPGWLLASFAAVLFSVVGDLYESRLKRRAGVKDSGGLLPGHGGLLDRVDGVLAATPVFAVVWRLAT